MNRRDFIKRIALGTAGLALAPAALALPARAIPVAPIDLAAMNDVMLRVIMPSVIDNYFKATPLLQYLRETDQQRWRGAQIRENFVYAGR